MITGPLKSKIDKLWLEFHSGGITNPLTVIEQISFLLFARMIDMRAKTDEKKSQRTGNAVENPLFTKDLEHLRWSHLINLGAEEQLEHLNGTPENNKGKRLKNLFQFFKEDAVKNSSLGEYLKDAQCAIQKPSLLKTAINMIDDLPLHRGDTKGDLYEYLLSKLGSAGVAGQFRTPRHIIACMAELVDIQPTDTICDPACGTGGFLVASMEYLRRNNTSPDMVQDELDEDGKLVIDDHGQPVKSYPGDLLDEYRKHINKGMFNGFDFDSTMLRIAAMNMLLHGLDNPGILYKDSLSEKANVPAEYNEHFDVVLANPPFKGSIDGDSVFKGLTSVAKTKKTELLFLVLIEKILKTGGRAAVIVPDGVLFGSSGAHRAVREMLIEQNQLEAVISLPSGVFKPYAGVSTAILIFTKKGVTDNVWFYKVEKDGYSLDDRRTPEKESDLPDLCAQWSKWKDVRDGKKSKAFADREQRAFFVSKEDIVKEKYDLSYSRYAEVVYEEVGYEKPKVIINKLRKLEDSISKDLSELEDLLK